MTMTDPRQESDPRRESDPNSRSLDYLRPELWYLRDKRKPIIQQPTFVVTPSTKPNRRFKVVLKYIDGTGTRKKLTLHCGDPKQITYLDPPEVIQTGPFTTTYRSRPNPDVYKQQCIRWNHIHAAFYNPLSPMWWAIQLCWTATELGQAIQNAQDQLATFA